MTIIITDGSRLQPSYRTKERENLRPAVCRILLVQSVTKTKIGQKCSNHQSDAPTTFQKGRVFRSVDSLGGLWCMQGLFGEGSVIHSPPAVFSLGGGQQLAYTYSTPKARITSQWLSKLRRLWTLSGYDCINRGRGEVRSLKGTSLHLKACFVQRVDEIKRKT